MRVRFRRKDPKVTEEEMLERLQALRKIQINRAQTIEPTTMTYGPRLFVQCNVVDSEGASGTAVCDIALNEQRQLLIACDIKFGEEETYRFQLRMLQDPPEALQQLADRIIRLLAMLQVEGYVEYDQRVHLAFVVHADV
jgi:hypothetical protein